MLRGKKERLCMSSKWRAVAALTSMCPTICCLCLAAITKCNPINVSRVVLLSRSPIIDDKSSEGEKSHGSSSPFIIIMAHCPEDVLLLLLLDFQTRFAVQAIYNFSYKHPKDQNKGHLKTLNLWYLQFRH